jgi:hypothetical protein
VLSYFARSAVAALALASTLGCVRSAPEAQTVTEVPGGMWIAGTDGLAAFSDGRTVVRHDYPFRSRAPDWARGRGSYPTARVVRTPTMPWLFTSYADVLRWTGTEWERLPARWPIEDVHQVDFAALAPDGAFVMQFHSDRLAWSIPGPLAASWAAERTPDQYYTWLGFFGDSLHGIGWLGHGPGRTLERRTGRERWEVLSELGAVDPIGVVRIPGGPLAVVTGQALLIAADGRTARVHPIAAIAGGEHPTARKRLQIAMPSSTPDAPPASPAPATSAPPVASVAVTPPATSAPPEPSERAVAMPSIASDAPPPSSVYVTAVLQGSGHGPMLLVAGADVVVVEIGERDVMVTPCGAVRGLPIAGAATTPAGLRLVTADLALVALEPGVGCRVVAPAAIRNEE